MEEFLSILQNVIIFVALAVPGYILYKTKIVGDNAPTVLSKILSFVGMPFLILNSLFSQDLHGEFLKTTLLVFVFGVLINVGFFFLSKVFVSKGEDKKVEGMRRFAMTFSNNGFLGIPLSVAVFGSDSPVTACVIVFNILTNTLMYVLGPSLASGGEVKTNVKKAVLNPVVLSFILGIILNLLGVASHVPPVKTYVGYFSNIVTPISMTIVGINLAKINLKTLVCNLSMYKIAVLKLIFMPILFSLLAFCLMKLGLFDRNTVFATFVAYAMPTAGLSATFADEYDGDRAGACVYVLGTTILCIATIPLLFLLLQALV